MRSGASPKDQSNHSRVRAASAVRPPMMSSDDRHESEEERQEYPYIEYEAEPDTDDEKPTIYAEDSYPVQLRDVLPDSLKRVSFRKVRVRPFLRSLVTLFDTEIVK